MTIKDELHALINELDEVEAREALGVLKARSELPHDVSRAYIDECEAAYDETFADGAVRLPHAAVRAWLLAWGTPGEVAAERELDALEHHLTKEVRDGAAS
jgi:hypothetical protein